MTSSILLVRHAAHGHLDHRLTGRMPGVPLSEAGQAQAAALARRLAGAALTRVETSPLQRTCETAAAIAEASGLPPPIPVDALIEIDMGAWTGAAFDDLAGDPAWARWNAERGTARIPGGESMAESQARIVGRMQAVARDGGTIVMVTHSDMIRAAVAHVLGLPLDNLLRFDVGPASVTRVEAGEWGMRLVSLNERA